MLDSDSLRGDLDRLVSLRLDGLFFYLLFCRGLDPHPSLRFFSFSLIDDLLPDVFLLPEAHLSLLQLAPLWNVLLPHVHLFLDLSRPTSPSVQLVQPFVD